MALYNTERPNDFSEIKGQENIVNIFKSMLESGNLPNAFLFVGCRGTGKTSSARIWSRALNCEHPTENGPCNECPSCKEILKESSMDIIELDAASNGGVDDVHRIIDMAQYAPIHKKKVLILDEVHMLSGAAFNALLKTIEEPPANVVFIFCTTEEHKVPATIVSRCRRFVFERIDDETIEATLREICTKYSISYEDEALGIIARAAKGGMRDAESILEQFMQCDITAEHVKEVLGITDEAITFEILEGIVNGDITKAVSALRTVIKKGKNLGVLLKSLIDALIDTVYTKQCGEKVNNTAEYNVCVERLLPKLTIDKAISYIDMLSSVYEVSRKDADMSFAIEMTLMKMVNYTSEVELLTKRVEALENGMVSIPKQAIKAEETIEAPTEEEAKSNVVPFIAGPAAPVVSEVPVVPETAVSTEAAEEEEVIPFDTISDLGEGSFSIDAISASLAGSEIGEPISLNDVDDEETETAPETVEENDEVPEEEENEQPAVVEPDMFSEFFAPLGSARQ